MEQKELTGFKMQGLTVHYTRGFIFTSLEDSCAHSVQQIEDPLIERNMMMH